MPISTKSYRDPNQKLTKARAQDARLLEKAKQARQKLDRRQAKLHRLEVSIAELEQQLYEPETERLGQERSGREQLRHARLILNPKAGEGVHHHPSPEEIVGALRTHGIIAEINLKTSGKAARELAKAAARNAEDLVIVAGGDGTIEDVAFQLLGTATTLGILPFGTMNNLARALGIPLDLDAASALIGAGLTRQIDVGRMTAEQGTEVSYFLETAGLGLSAIALPAGQALEKGHWRVLPPAIHRIVDAQPTPVAIKLDDAPVIRARTVLVTVSNAPIMGKNLVVGPYAKMDDGWLDVATYDGMSKHDLLRYLMAITSSYNAEALGLRFYRARKVRIKYSLPPDANTDKDTMGGRREIKIQVLRQALRVIVGKGVALSLPVETVPPPREAEQRHPLTQPGNGFGNLMERFHILGDFHNRHTKPEEEEEESI